MLLRQDRVLSAVAVMLDVAFHGGRTTVVGAADIAERVGATRRGLEPMLQTLSRAGLLDSVRGPRGGYRLGRPRRDITLAEIAAAADGEPDDATTPPGQLQAAVVDPLWRELNQTMQDVMAKLSLEDMLRRAAAAGLTRQAAEPISYSI